MDRAEAIKYAQGAQTITRDNPVVLDFYKTAEAALRELEQREWISAKERLPYRMDDVLVRAFWHEKWGVRLGWYSERHNCWHIFTPSGDKAWIEVTHWMPLPEPPKEDA